MGSATPTETSTSTLLPTFPTTSSMPTDSTAMPSLEQSAMPSLEPSASPSNAVSPAPTMMCNLSEEGREMLIMSFLEMISSPGSLEMEGSPQNLAANWLINEDMAYLCPQDPTLIQRYSMAVFYYHWSGIWLSAQRRCRNGDRLFLAWRWAAWFQRDQPPAIFLSYRQPS